MIPVSLRKHSVTLIATSSLSAANRFQTFEKVSGIPSSPSLVFCPSTHSSDPDMDMALDKIVPEDLNWLHTDEGPE